MLIANLTASILALLCDRISQTGSILKMLTTQKVRTQSNRNGILIWTGGSGTTPENAHFQH